MGGRMNKFEFIVMSRRNGMNTLLSHFLKNHQRETNKEDQDV